jgi:hypothetical protein
MMLSSIDDRPLWFRRINSNVISTQVLPTKAPPKVPSQPIFISRKSNVEHSSAFQGKWEKIGEVDCYVATPEKDYPKDKAILLLPDVFGPQLINAQVRKTFIVPSTVNDADRIPSFSLTTLPQMGSR